MLAPFFCAKCTFFTMGVIPKSAKNNEERSNLIDMKHNIAHKLCTRSRCRYHIWAVLALSSFLFVACRPLSEANQAAMPTATSKVGLHQDLKSITPTVPKPVTPLATPQPAVPQILPGDWSTYLMGNNGFNGDETLINATTAAQLHQYWMYHALGSISAQPLVVNGIIYWGSWDGLEHATNLSGQQLWATNLGKTDDNDCDPPSAGVASTATVAPITTNGRTTLTLFVGGGDANFYALNASTGKVIWKVALGFSPDDFIWSSPLVYKGSIYIGVSSFGDCPSVQGKLVQLSTLDGSVQNIFDVVPDGCGGGSIWGSPTIDTQTGKIYVATGNADYCSTVESYAIAIVELNASDLSVVDDWQVPQSQWLDDSDFGTTPTLFNASINGQVYALVGVVNKNGIYYTFDRNALSNGPIWTLQVSNAEGSIAPGAWDGHRLYVGGGNTTINGKFCQGSVRALDPATGNIIWERCLQDDRELAPITAAPGIVVAGNGHFVVVVEADTGKQLFSFKDPAKGSLFYAAPAIAHGMMYVGNMDGNFFAFGYHLPGHNLPA